MNFIDRYQLFPREGALTDVRWLSFVFVGTVYIFLSSAFFSIAINSLSLGLIGISWVGIMMYHRRISIVSTPLDYFFLAYVIAELTAAALSVNPSQAFLFSKRLFLIAIVYMFASSVRTVVTAKRFLAVLLGTASIVGTLGVLKVLFQDPSVEARLGIFQFYMTTSELMMISALLLVPFILHSATPKRVRVLAIIGILPILFSLYATVTRGAYLAFGAGIIFLALMKNRKLIFPLLAILLILIAFAPPYVVGRVQSIFDPAHPDNASRLMLWEAGLKIFADNPFFGVGDIDLYQVFVNYVPAGTEVSWGHLHNVLLQFLITLGGVGFLCVAAMFIQIFRIEWKVYQSNKDDWFLGSLALGALAVFIGFQTSGLTEWSFGDQEVVILFWTTVGLVLGIRNMSVESNKQTM